VICQDLLQRFRASFAAPTNIEDMFRSDFLHILVRGILEQAMYNFSKRV
jgi:hypothetical protein